MLSDFCLHCTFNMPRARCLRGALPVNEGRHRARRRGHNTMRDSQWRPGCHCFGRRMSGPLRRPSGLQLNRLMPSHQLRRLDALVKRPCAVSPGRQGRLSTALWVLRSLLEPELFVSRGSPPTPGIAGARPVIATAEIPEVWRVLRSPRAFQAVLRFRSLWDCCPR